MKVGQINYPRFRVEVPGGNFSRLMILNRGANARREAIAEEINIGLLRSRELGTSQFASPKALRELEEKGYIYSATEAMEAGCIQPENIAYDRIFGGKRSTVVEPPKPRTASEYFLDFCNTKRIDENFIKKYPLLAAFLDESRLNSARSSLDEALEQRFPHFGSNREELSTGGDKERWAIAEIMAQTGASEIELCAALYYAREFKIDNDNYWRNQNSYDNDPYGRDIIAGGLRLGIDRKLLSEGIYQVKKIAHAAIRAEMVGIYSLSVSDIFLPTKMLKNPPRVYETDLNAEQAINLINMIRSILSTKESKLLYAASKLYRLSQLADERFKLAEEWERTQKARELNKNREKGSSQEKEPELELNRLSEYKRLEYFFQVLPVVEELHITALAEKVKDAYFKAYNPYRYLRIQRWFENVVQHNAVSAQKHLDNILRLVRAVGKTTGLLPEGAEVFGRVKTNYSIYEKFATEAEAELPFSVLHDLFAFRVLLTGTSDIAKVAYMMRRTFMSIDVSIRKIIADVIRYSYADPRSEADDGRREEVRERMEQASVPELLSVLIDAFRPVDPRLDRNLKFTEFEVLKKARLSYLLAVSEQLKKGGLLYRKGYRKGVKDSIGGQKKRGVYYYSMVLASPDNIPMEAQLTTAELEKRTEQEAPHWKYKLVKQFEIAGIGKNIKPEDIELQRDGVYVVKIDSGSHRFSIDFIPKKQAHKKYFPGFTPKPAEYPWPGFYSLGKKERKAMFNRLRNGYILIKMA
jgi:hypothetical protein